MRRQLLHTPVGTAWHTSIFFFLSFQISFFSSYCNTGGKCCWTHAAGGIGLLNCTPHTPFASAYRCAYTHTYACTHTHTHTHTHTLTRTQPAPFCFGGQVRHVVCVCRYTHTWRCTHTHTHTHIHTHTHTHTHKRTYHLVHAYNNTHIRPPDPVQVIMEWMFVGCMLRYLLVMLPYYIN